MYSFSVDVETDIIFALDALAMGKKKTQSVYKFLTEVSKDINDGDKVHMGVVSRNCFDDDVTLDHQNTTININNTEYEGLQHQVRRLRQTSFSPRNGGRKNAKKVAVLFIDDTFDDYDSLALEAGKAKVEDEIEVFVVAIGNDVDFSFCGGIVSDPIGRHVIKVSSHDDLALLKDDFIISIGNGS